MEPGPELRRRLKEGRTSNAGDRDVRRVIERGRLTGRAWLTIAAPSLRNTPGMNEVLRAHDAEEGRRRRLYGAS